jgi:prepilin-type N-terminal cleavage/methylation domain-containing protein
MKIFSSRSGFTLIELMVAISIMALLFGVGLAGYQQFNQSRKATEAAKTFRSDLNFARSKALAGEKKTGCQNTDILAGWYLRTGASSYSLYCRCGGSDLLEKTVSLASVSLSPAGQDILFKPLAQGTNLPSSLSLTLAVGSYQEVVLVSQSGEIN